VTKNKNKIRALLREFFPKREWVTLVRPVQEEVDLQKLDSLANDELRPEFLNGIWFLKDKIFTEISPKILNGSQVTGEVLVDLCSSYVDAINNGSVPSIESAWDYICQFECEKQIKSLIPKYKTFMSEILNAWKLSQSEVDEKHKELCIKFESEFNENKIGEKEDTNKYFSILEKKLEEAYAEVLGSFKDRQIESIQKYLNDLVSDMDMKIRKGDVYNSIQQFFRALDEESDEFERKFPLIDSEKKAFYWKQKTKKLVNLCFHP
jgi:hypothetical protein